MKLKKDYELFGEELKQLCERHRIGIIGTCNTEGIYGEITLVDLDGKTESEKNDIRNIDYTVREYDDSYIIAPKQL